MGIVPGMASVCRYSNASATCKTLVSLRWKSRESFLSPFLIFLPKKRSPPPWGEENRRASRRKTTGPCLQPMFSGASLERAVRVRPTCRPKECGLRARRTNPDPGNRRTSANRNKKNPENPTKPLHEKQTEETNARNFFL